MADPGELARARVVEAGPCRSFGTHQQTTLDLAARWAMRHPYEERDASEGGQPAAPRKGNPHTPEARRLRAWVGRKLAEAAIAAGADWSADLADRILSCGSGTVVGANHAGGWVPLRADDGTPLRSVYTCMHRLCPHCARKRSARALARLAPAIAERFRAKPALLTLTIDDRPGESLEGAFERITKAWRRVRETQAFTGPGGRRAAWPDRTVRGGVYSLEVTRSNRGSWHVHLHAIVDTDWLDQAEMLRAWRRALGSGPRKGGARIERLNRGLAEGLKYTTKPQAAATLPLAERVELLAWMRGRRMMATFGTLYRLPVEEPDCPEEEGQDLGAAVGRHPWTGRTHRADAAIPRSDRAALDAAARILAARLDGLETAELWEPIPHLARARPECPDRGGGRLYKLIC